MTDDYVFIIICLGDDMNSEEDDGEVNVNYVIRIPQPCITSAFETAWERGELEQSSSCYFKSLVYVLHIDTE